MHEICKAIKDVGTSDRSMVWNTDLIESLELQNLMALSSCTMVAADWRKESRGAHAHENFPERNDADWLKHTLTYWDDETKKVTIGSRPVHLHTLDEKEVQSFPPKKRVY